MIRLHSLVFAFVIGLAACAPLPGTSAMVPDPAGVAAGQSPAPAYRNSIAVGSVSVGRDTGTPWRAGLGAPQIEEALLRTLMKAGLAQGATGRFRLDAVLLTLDRPYAGFAMTVTATIAWRLTEVSSGVVVYDRTLSALGTATLDDAVGNDDRLRIADQRAVRANLQQLLRDLYALPAR